MVEYNFLIWSRLQKNILYILCGIIIGASVFLPMTRIDKIILIVGFVIFVIEAILYLICLISILKDSLKTKQNRKVYKGEKP